MHIFIENKLFFDTKSEYINKFKSIKKIKPELKVEIKYNS